MAHEVSPSITPEEMPNGSLVNKLGQLYTELAISNMLVEYWNYASNHDPLTGLYTKAAITERINERMTEGSSFGVIELDLDGFKRINDTLGHGRGDQLLEEFGPFLSKLFKREGEELSHEIIKPGDKPKSQVGRTGGDEFLILVNLREEDKKSSNEEMDSILNYTRSALDKFVRFQPKEIRKRGFNVSMGGAVWRPGSNLSAKKLLSRVDKRMYQDKLDRGGSR